MFLNILLASHLLMFVSEIPIISTFSSEAQFAKISILCLCIFSPLILCVATLKNPSFLLTKLEFLVFSLNPTFIPFSKFCSTDLALFWAIVPFPWKTGPSIFATGAPVRSGLRLLPQNIFFRFLSVFPRFPLTYLCSVLLQLQAMQLILPGVVLCLSWPLPLSIDFLYCMSD